MLWILLACVSSTENSPVSETPPTTKTTTKLPTYPLETDDGMVRIPSGLVLLGPQKRPPIPGYQPPQMPNGMTPNGGEGQFNRAPGAPPMPSQQSTNPKNGVGHVRPGSGVPSAPPNMPGARPKMQGEERPWTAEPSFAMKPKKVTVSPFWIDLTEVTRAEYKIFLDNTGYRPPFIAEEWAKDGWNWTGTDYPEGTGEHPIIMVNWYDAVEYCKWRGKRLPTEAEWQLATFGDLNEGRDYPWGSEYDHDVHNHGQIASPNFDDSDGYLTTSPVGSFPAGQSPYGLQDTFGNAWEFTSDARRSSWTYYQNASGTSPTDTSAPTPSLYVAVRGGSYFFDLRPNPSGERNEFLTEVRRKTSGFRCAR